jgi:hypothetical protein
MKSKEALSVEIQGVSCAWFVPLLELHMLLSLYFRL